MENVQEKIKLKDIIKAIGTVFGDIGTSPLYTLSVIILITKPKPDEIFGIRN